MFQESNNADDGTQGTDCSFGGLRVVPFETHELLEPLHVLKRTTRTHGINATGLTAPDQRIGMFARARVTW
jgi:hypothetical protein